MANNVAINCDNKWEADVSDFSAKGESYWKGFYMQKIYTYAQKANDQYDLEVLKDWFQSMECIVDD